MLMSAIGVIVCQKSHHTLLHIGDTTSTPADSPSTSPTSTQVPAHTAVKLKSSALLMTCHVLVATPNGSRVEARALLDNASSASFVSERLVQSLSLSRTRQNVRVSGIAGTSPTPSTHSIATFQSPLHTAMGGALSSQPLSCRRSLVIFPPLLSLSICPGATSLTCHWLIPVSASQVKSTSFLVWTSSLRSCSMAGGNFLVLPQPLRPSSGGFLVVRQTKTLL